MESHRRGELTEAVVVAELIRRGIPVLRPFGDNERYDVVAETPEGSLLKLQVKTGRLLNGTVTFEGISMHTNSQGNVYKPYDGDVDYFLVYSHDIERLYLVPEEEVGSSMALRVDPPKRTDPKINPAADYEFDRNWPLVNEDTVRKPEFEGTGGWSTSYTNRGPIQAFEAMGVPVYRYTGSDSTFIAEIDDRSLLRIETRRLYEDNGRLRVNPTESKTDSKNGTTHYALYTPARDETYLMDAAEFDPSLSLRTDDPDQVQHNTRWAEDYRLESVWPPDGAPTVAPKSAVGAAVEQFEALGVPVGFVRDDTVPYDLLVEAEEGFTRIAVAPVWPSRGCLRLKPDSCENIDAFVIYYREKDACYIVDAAEFDRSISLRIDEPAKADPTINWAAEYELENRWPV
jgi:hypothetical protein